MNNEQLARVRTGEGFIAALDQSGGSTPKALRLYGIEESEYSGDAQMFDLIHQMRARIITSPAFDGDRILGAILFEMTMDRTIEGIGTAEYLWTRASVVPFLKVDKGLADDDVVGYVFAVNGKINSADIYPSNALFRKMWRKNFDASVTEALAAKGEGLAEAPQPAAVLAFLDAAEAGKPSEREVAGRTRLETREGVGNFMFETRSAKGAYLHRNYLAK